MVVGPFRRAKSLERNPRNQQRSRRTWRRSSSPGGRKSNRVPVDYAIGFDLGGSSVKAVAVTTEGETLAQKNVPFDPAVSMRWARTIQDLLAALKSEVGMKMGEPRIGLSAPGLAARNRRAIAV